MIFFFLSSQKLVECAANFFVWLKLLKRLLSAINLIILTLLIKVTFSWKCLFFPPINISWLNHFTDVYFVFSFGVIAEVDIISRVCQKHLTSLIIMLQQNVTY
jgi:hypothetical protein